MAEWLNKDGLLVKFGTTEAEDTHVGEYGIFSDGSIHHLQLLLNPESLGGVGKKVHWSCRLPGANGQTMFIDRADVHVEVPFDSAGDALTLTFGLDNVDGTVFDADGIDASIAQAAIDAVNDRVVCDGAQVGVRLVNTKSLVLTSTVGGAAPTAGKGWLNIYYFLVNE